MTQPEDLVDALRQEGYLPPAKAPTQRILDLFDLLWPTDRWHVEKEATGTTATIQIRSQDRKVFYALIHFNKKLVKGGFEVNVSYPAFNGSIEEMDDAASVIAALGPVLTRMQTTDLIQKGI